MALEHPPALPWWYWWKAADHLSSRLISDHPHHHLVPGAVQSECEGHSHQRGSTLVSPPSPSSYLFLLSTFSSERHIVYLFVCVYHSFYLYSLRLVRLECLECTFCTGATSLNDGCFRFEWLAMLECCNTSSTAGFLQRQRFELRKHQQHIFASPIITVCVFGKLRFYPHIDSYLFCSRF